ncbi:winged helix DNA-binding domain-containing protein [Nocardioides sp. 31GB23]|uniref:winged helix DNA-binding domain-containing protein n=1 Tax=Nocardioides sp. 31GB23 TaxID=3156065 RepID=UPI0032AFD185
MREVSVGERRARLARRHAVAPAHRVGDAVGATRAVVALHATEPATVHLSVQARVDDAAPGAGGLDHALHVDRSLVRQLAMRRTLFVFPLDLLGAAWGSAAARVAQSEGARLVKDLTATGEVADPARWLERVRAGVLEVLGSEPGGLTALELRSSVPGLEVRLAAGGATYAGSRVLTWLGARGEVVRGHSTTHWRQSRPRWTLAEHWLGEPPAALAPAEGYAALVRRWLERFGPATEADLVWWLGATKGAVRAALGAVGAREVDLEGGGPGHLLPDDLEEEPPVEPWAALLPVLDPTVMGWKQRDFYLSEHAAVVFDRNGNAGTTAWWDGRVVGCWVQDPDGVVEVRVLDDVGREARARLGEEAARLTRWLAGQRVGTVYPSPAMRADPGDLTYPVVRA